MLDSFDSSSAADASPGARIRWLRIMRNMTQRDLAGGEYSVSYVSAIERGRVKPTLGMLTWCAQRLGVSLTTLLGEGNGARDQADARQAAAKLAYEQVHAQLLLNGGEVTRGREELELVRRAMGESAPRSLAWLAAYGANLDGDTDAALRDAAVYQGNEPEKRSEQVRAAAHWLFGMIYARRQDAARAVAEYTRALELEGLAYFDLDAAMMIRGDLSRLLVATGDLPAAATLAAAALQEYAEFADPTTRTRRARERAEQSAATGNWFKAYQFIRWAWESQREAKVQREAARSYLRGALLAMIDGGMAPERELRQALALAAQAHDDEAALLAAALLALTLAERGDLAAAQQVLRAPPLAGVSETTPQQPAPQGALLAAQGWMAYAAGEREAARQHAMAAETVLVAVPDELRIVSAAVYMSLSRLYEALDEPLAALLALRHVMALSRSAP